MENFTVVDNHSVALGLVGDGAVLDAGCRGFRFARFFAALGNRVVAMDPAPETYVPEDLRQLDNFRFYKTALVGPMHPRQAYLRMTEDAEARHVVTSREKDSDPLVHCMTIADVMNGVCQEWALMKLNIEGAEFQILNQMIAPLSRQIVVSFHEHTPQAVGRGAVDALIGRLGRWYEVHNHVWERRYGCTENYWDTVLIRRPGVGA